VINTVTHTEVARSVSTGSLYSPRLGISLDSNSLYAGSISGSTRHLFKFNVSTDIIPASVSTSHTSDFWASTSILVTADNLVFTDAGQVWTPDLKGKIGTTGASGQVAYIPNRNAVAIASSATNSIVFAGTENFYTLSMYSLPGPMGPIVSQSDGNRLFVSTSCGIISIDISGSFPGTPGTLPSGSLPYFDLVLDERRDVMYGSNSTGHRIDVLSMSTLQVVDRIQFNNGAKPLGMDLSPDGSELAVALNGTSSLAFVDPDTRTISATVIPNANGLNAPYDVKYGRAGRLYASGTSDYIHVIDTAAYSEVGRSANTLHGTTPDLAISSTKDALFANSRLSPNTLYKFDISTDNLVNLVNTDPAPHDFTGETYVLSTDDSKIFTSGNEVWKSDLSLKIGRMTSVTENGRTLYGRPAILPNHNAIVLAFDKASGSDMLAFVSTDDFYTLTTHTLPGTGTLGALAADAAGTKLYVSSTSGMIAVALTPALPGTPVPLPSGSLPYYDLVLDEGRSVLYGSDWVGSKIDVISLSSLQVTHSFRLPNGTGPQSMALSPDGSELVIAQVDAGGLLFLDPDTGETVATLAGRPVDFIYGRANRLYVKNSGFNNGYIDVIDTATHTKVGT
jgi:DNA-binding beta-propeller fold protein YncE